MARPARPELGGLQALVEPLKGLLSTGSGQRAEGHIETKRCSMVAAVRPARAEMMPARANLSDQSSPERN